MTWPRQPLLLVGLASWAGAVTAWVLIEADTPAWLRALVVVTAPAVAVVPWIVPAPARLGFGAALTLLGLLAGAASAGAYLGVSRPPEVREWAATHAQVLLTGTVREPPGGASGGSGTVRVAVDLHVIGEPGPRQVDAGQPEPRHVEGGRAVPTTAVLLGTREEFGQVQRGTRLAVRGTMLPLAVWRESAITVAVHDVVERAPPRRSAGFVAEARARMWQALESHDPDAASLVAGLAIGDDSRQSAELGDAMRVSGLSHLTAVSGGNVMILAGAVILAASWAGAALPLRIGAAVASVVGYAAFVGPQPSVLRATVMGCVALVGLMRSTRSGGLPALGAAVLLLICVWPQLALSWGFTLSVSATAGILVLAPPLEALLERRLPGLPHTVAAAFCVTVAAQLATAPLLAAMTGGVSTVGPAANLAAAPLVVPITLLGLLLVVAANIWLPAAAVVAWTVEPFGQLLAAVAHTAAAVPHATIAVPPGAGVAVCGAVVMVLMAVICIIGRDRSQQPPGARQPS